MQAQALSDLIECGAAALRSDPSDFESVAGADQALATSFDSLQYLIKW